MNRNEFDGCLEEAKKMFHLKEMSLYVSDVFFDEFNNIEKKRLMKSFAYAAANGQRFTLDNIFTALTKIISAEPPKPRIISECKLCSNGVRIVGNYAYSCTCEAGANCPNYPQYSGQTEKNLKITEHEEYTVREFKGYTIKSPKNCTSVTHISFDHVNVNPKGA